MAEAPISLYFDLADGRKADLRAVAKAAAAWASAVEEIVFQFDPTLEVRIEFESGTPGSLSLNSVISSVRDTVTDRKAIKTAVIGAIIWLTLEVGSWTVGEVLDRLSGPDAPEDVRSLSQEELEELAEMIVRRLRKTAKPQARELYQQAQRDEAIIGLGATAAPGKRPKVMVPRSEFDARSSYSSVWQESDAKRVTVESVRVVLLSPMLAPDAPNRRWKFAGPMGEFGATIKDTEFLRSVWSGETSLPMRPGIEMFVELETVEEAESGFWKPVSYSIKNVKSLALPQPSLQVLLPFPGQGQIGDASDDDGESD